jgi:hypothetical protein
MTSPTVNVQHLIHFDHTEVELLNASLRLSSATERKLLVLAARAQQPIRLVTDDETDALSTNVLRPLSPFIHRCAREPVIDTTLDYEYNRTRLHSHFSQSRYVDLDQPTPFEVVLDYDDPVDGTAVDMTDLPFFEQTMYL